MLHSGFEMYSDMKSPSALHRFVDNSDSSAAHRLLQSRAVPLCIAKCSEIITHAVVLSAVGCGATAGSEPAHAYINDDAWESL